MLELLLLTFVLLALWILARGAVFVPTHHSKVEIMLRLAEVKPGQKVADLGSGDGRIIIAFAKEEAEARGYEINPLLVWWSRRKIKQAGVQERAKIHLQSFWGADLSEFDVVIVFGIGHIMKKLAVKLRAELKPGTKVISFAFPLPGWNEIKKDRGVFLYTIT